LKLGTKVPFISIFDCYKKVILGHSAKLMSIKTTGSDMCTLTPQCTPRPASWVECNDPLKNAEREREREKMEVKK
jgi:hypothetical protein